MINYTEALAMVRSKAHSFGTETIPLDQAYGRALAGLVRSDRDYPPFDRATMDGYALRSNDLQQHIRAFRIIETILAGDSATRSLSSAECYKIMTGASVPAGADIVIRREDTIEEGSVVRIQTETTRPWLNIARRGEDLKDGDIVIDSPCMADPAIIGLLASLGQKELKVAQLPRVALITTGNEIVPMETTPGPTQIRNSNRWLLQAFLKKWQIDPWLYQHAPDDKILLRAALEKALPADMVILCGGVSAGDADHVPETLEAAGVTRLFHKLAIKPGKPVWCGSGPRDTMVFALPGNPFSCLVGFILLIQPYLKACFGVPEEGPLSLPMSVAKKKSTPLDEFFPVRVQGAPAGLLPVSLNGSGDIRLGMQANALALHPSGMPDLAAGDNVAYLSL
ncbi:MAG TPA: molybdopterin molybdotransferase MoeA [Puia sp.]|nr:molybdopterin molybdotransferase MoeA [Puia sp.]